MVRRDGAEARKERLHTITQRVLALLNNEGEADLPKTVDILCYEYGLTRPRINEYLEIAANSGRFVLDLKSNKIRKICPNGHQSTPL